jgi:hypothetical protein
MHIGLDAAVEIYAKACRSWYGSRAKDVVLERSQELLTAGDREGWEVWRRVASEIDRLAGQPAH